MASRVQDTEALTTVELVAESGLGGMAESVALLIDEAMCLERRCIWERCRASEVRRGMGAPTAQAQDDGPPLGS